MKSIRQLIRGFRTEYISDGIEAGNLSENPIDQFEKWMTEAVKSGAYLPNAMHLSTVDGEGKPSGRIVLLRGFDERGFQFFTNYNSRKGNELKVNHHASLTFFWSELYRQVRIEGDVFMTSEAESDEYFQSRPRESQISALASEQSSVLENRLILIRKVSELEHLYKGKTVPRPANWGGYYLSPVSIEFWQGMAHRLHDRLVYKLGTDNRWTIQRLFP